MYKIQCSLDSTLRLRRRACFVAWRTLCGKTTRGRGTNEWRMHSRTPGGQLASVCALLYVYIIEVYTTRATFIVTSVDYTHSVARRTELALLPVATSRPLSGYRGVLPTAAKYPTLLLVSCGNVVSSIVGVQRVVILSPTCPLACFGETD